MIEYEKVTDGEIKELCESAGLSISNRTPITVIADYDGIRLLASIIQYRTVMSMNKDLEAAGIRIVEVEGTVQ